MGDCIGIQYTVIRPMVRYRGHCGALVRGSIGHLVWFTVCFITLCKCGRCQAQGRALFETWHEINEVWFWAMLKPGGNTSCILVFVKYAPLGLLEFGSNVKPWTVCGTDSQHIIMQVTQLFFKL